MVIYLITDRYALKWCKCTIFFFLSPKHNMANCTIAIIISNLRGPFDSYFYNRLINSGYESVCRWTKRVNIFSKTKLFIPINIKRRSFSHRVLVYLDATRRYICYYDSIFKYDRFLCSYKIAEYLMEEHRDKLKRPLPVKDWNFAYLTNPYQNNGMDCVVFVCTFAEYLSRDAEFNFSQMHMRSFRQLLAHELNIKKLIAIDADENNIDEFFNSVIKKN